MYFWRYRGAGRPGTGISLVVICYCPHLFPLAYHDIYVTLCHRSWYQEFSACFISTRDSIFAVLVA